jgi:hypothetical protein
MLVRLDQAAIGFQLPDPGYHQAVPGRFVRMGGPVPGSFPLPGTITARAVTGQTSTATVGHNGRFTLSVPPGRYHVTTGRSLLMQSGQALKDR